VGQNFPSVQVIDPARLLLLNAGLANSMLVAEITAATANVPLLAPAEAPETCTRSPTLAATKSATPSIRMRPAVPTASVAPVPLQRGTLHTWLSPSLEQTKSAVR